MVKKVWLVKPLRQAGVKSIPVKSIRHSFEDILC
jgi:hypothetical protein